MITRFFALLLLLLTTAGCGQKGPLVLPQPDSGDARNKPAPAPEEETRNEAADE